MGRLRTWKPMRFWLRSSEVGEELSDFVEKSVLLHASCFDLSGRVCVIGICGDNQIDNQYLQHEQGFLKHAPGKFNTPKR